MRTIDDQFRDLVARSRALDDDAEEQLRHAAQALARMEPWMATSITCTRHVPAEQIAALTELARELAVRHGLAVQVTRGTPVSVRFSRRPALASGPERAQGSRTEDILARLARGLHVGHGRATSKT